LQSTFQPMKPRASQLASRDSTAGPGKMVDIDSKLHGFLPEAPGKQGHIMVTWILSDIRH
jgi:hypothetical protein